jgi:hypothetical protein
MWGHHIAALSILHTSQQLTLAASQPKRPLCTFLPPCNPSPITAALTRCYSKPRLPTPLPSQWRGRASRARDKRRELPEQDSFTPRTSSHSVVVNQEEQSTARLIKKKEETTTSRPATMPRGPGSASRSNPPIHGFIFLACQSACCNSCWCVWEYLVVN